MKKLSFILCVAFIMLAMIFASCTRHCTSSKPYYCSSYDICCPYPYYAVGSGYCYQLQSDCQATGYYCVRCSFE